MQKFVDVIVPLPLVSTFTYALPHSMEDQVMAGCRVVVPFGKKKCYTAIVVRVHDVKPEGYEVKEVQELLDATPILLPGQVEFWAWMADYYLCSIGEVYKAALPSGLKMESETKIERCAEFEDYANLTPREQQLFNSLPEGKELTLTTLEKDSKMKNVWGIVRHLLDKQAVVVKEEMKQGYRPKWESRVRLTPAARNEHRLHIFFDELQRRAPKQLDLLMKYLELSGALQPTPEKEVSKQLLLQKAGCTAAVFNGLVQRGVLEVYRSEVDRIESQSLQADVPLHPLGAAQQRAYDAIRQAFLSTPICLLHGVTSSGKTEIYIHLIREQLQQGRQVLYLLPEIALTTQITQRLRRVFGSRMGVYHSKFPDAERVEIWKKQLSDHPYEIILGVRSSIFLPFQRLGLIIVDEEHENTYKQQDPAPRYNARNAALVLAARDGARTLLGTATPSLESWYHATVTHKYALVELKERFRQIELPEIVPLDIKELQRTKRMKGAFAPLLLKHIRESLERKEQVILFQNCRGFAPMMECHTCGWVPKCKYCDVSLTYHKGMQMVTCHYCGYTEPLPRRCPACEGSDLRTRGFGTEKIEEEVKILFPEARVARMDLDTTRTRQAFERIISDFQQGRTDILIGTQMVSKGLDFERVSVVGILHADTMLNYPDFRAYERAFQMMAQVAGRAGRSGRRGLVLLQTKHIDHPILGQVIANDYESMAAGQLAERQQFRYPPYYRLIYIYLKHRSEQTAEQLAQAMAERLRQCFGTRVLGPDKPPVARVQTLFIRKMMIKIEMGASLPSVRQALRLIQQEMMSNPQFKSAILYYDVDPM